ncbi:MAG: hypothetical protein QOF79_1257 [Actinomycetota bacterium]|nr:hypothetical protein [Actinomycetota bacterium]
MVPRRWGGAYPRQKHTGLPPASAERAHGQLVGGQCGDIQAPLVGNLKGGQSVRMSAPK